MDIIKGVLVAVWDVLNVLSTSDLHRGPYVLLWIKFKYERKRYSLFHPPCLSCQASATVRRVCNRIRWGGTYSNQRITDKPIHKKAWAPAAPRHLFSTATFLLIYIRIFIKKIFSYFIVINKPLKLNRYLLHTNFIYANICDLNNST